MTETTRKKGLSRRTLLKSTAGLAGLAAGSGAITGFPYVMSAEPKVLRYLGTAVNEGDEISKQCLKDTGIKIEYITATTDDVTKRVMTQPNSFDVLDTEYFALKKIVPSGNILALDARKIKEFDNITPVFTKGVTPGGKKIGGQGTAPWKVLYLEGKDSKKFATSATEFVTLIPTVYNADTLGIRPDIIKRPISSWAELLNPEFKGKASILNIPSIGIMDAAMVVEATGKYKYADKGNMTKEEIDLTMKVMTEAKKAGQFRAFWKDFNESVNLMASGETVIQSMWSPAVTKVRSMGIACTFQPLKEGYRSPGPPASASPRASRVRSSNGPMSSSTGSCPAMPAPISTARATTRPCSPPRRRIWSLTSGPIGWKARRPRRTSRRPTARCSRRLAPCATAAPTRTAWAASRAGTP
ncbi:putative spermidine/putrescine transport system substrate-binding protein [Bradyrhizobium sp. GM0.4]